MIWTSGPKFPKFYTIGRIIDAVLL